MEAKNGGYDFKQLDRVQNMRDERLPYSRGKEICDKIPHKILKISMRSRCNYYKIEEKESDDEE